MSYSPGLSLEDQNTLLKLAARSIAHGLASAEPLNVDAGAYPPALRKEAATFVTLHLKDQFQGCIGTLRPHRPLVLDAVCNAYAAAFEDPRGHELVEDDLRHLKIDISILSDAVPMAFQSEEDLLAQLRPGVDGLILRDNVCCGTFLPSVWASLPQPREFLTQLKRKAGLPAGYWSTTVAIHRYTTCVFSNR